MVVESGGPYSSHSPPLVQQPSRGNTLFHSPMEGHVDTPIGHAIASFGTHLNSSEDEEERRQYRASIFHTGY